MRSKLLAIAAALGVCWSVQASAHDIKVSSASGLLKNCTYQSDDESEVEFHTGICLGFIKAVMNMHPTHGKTFCISPEMSNGDLIRDIREALYVLPPEMMEAPSHVVIAAVFEVRYKCSRK